MSSSGLTIVIATSTAVVVIALTLLLSELIRTAIGRASAATGAAFAFPATLVARAIDWGRSTDVKFRQSKIEEGEPPAHEEAPPMPVREPSVDSGTPEYREVGEEVAAVLSAARQAAAQISDAAQREAERIRLEADERAAVTLAEAEARRAEADRYREQTRSAADAYAEETRRKAEQQAAQRLSLVEEQARRIQVEAEEMSRELEAEARRRSDALAKSTAGMEARIESVLGVFRGVVTELEELLPADRRSTADELRLEKALDSASWQR